MPEKFKQILSAGKLMETVFWDSKGVLTMESMQQGATIVRSVFQNIKTLRRVGAIKMYVKEESKLCVILTWVIS
jgi:hypothetical protein